MGIKLRYVLLPALAITGVGLTLYTVKLQARPAPAAPPTGEPTRSPFGNRVAGSGLVEPVTEIINVGTPMSGVVQSVNVQEGDEVKRGQTLFTIDQRMLRSQFQSASDSGSAKRLPTTTSPRSQATNLAQSLGWCVRSQSSVSRRR